jgi:hypothetical protein
MIAEGMKAETATAAKGNAVEEDDDDVPPPLVQGTFEDAAAANK